MMRRLPPAGDAAALEQENERLRRSVEELSVLNELATEIGGARGVEAVMQTVVQRSIRAVGAEQGVITLLDEGSGHKGHTLVREAATSAGREALRLEETLLGWMAHYRRPLRLNEPREDPRFRGAAWRPGVRSLLCAPLLVRAELRGVLTAFNKRGGPGGGEAACFSAGDERLLAIIAAQSAQVIENARLVEEERELLRMREQLRLAAELQARLLPAKAPDVPGYEVAGWSLSSEAVGGDFFDFIPLGGGRLGLAVGDVVGKGLPAALLMANVQATLRGQAPGAASVVACLERANGLLHASTSPREFVTLFYGVLDPDRHRFRYANAGHNRPLLVPAGMAPVRLETGGLALGLAPTTSYGEAEVELGPGDLLVVFSDGVTEAMDPDRDLFGEGRLGAVLEACRDSPAGSVIEGVADAVRRHAGGAPQSDDVTLLVVRRQA